MDGTMFTFFNSNRCSPNDAEGCKEERVTKKGPNPFWQMDTAASLSSSCSAHQTDGGCRKLSTEKIIRIAAERFIQFSTQSGFSLTIHPYASSLSGLSFDETQDVELAQHLFAAAEKVAQHQYNFANSLLNHCRLLASESGNPLRRTVFYFAEALQEKIDRETGRIKNERVGEEYTTCEMSPAFGSNMAFLALHQAAPLFQVTQFAGIQAVLEHISTASRIHLIDLQIRSGLQWTALIQALAKRNTIPVKLLKISAIGMRNKHQMEETGKRLQSFAQSFNLPFSFQIVFLSDINDLREDLLTIEAGEAVAVYSQMFLRTMISRPDSLENIFRVITRLKPRIMVVTEVEANHNSPSFVNRFIESVFFYSAYFDCLESCMDKENQYRVTIERIYFRSGIRDIVATEENKRSSRSVTINVWRSFFARFGMKEIKLSESSLFQANLVLKQFNCSDFCTLRNDGKCLIVGWKETPMHSLSTWNFS